MSMMLIASECKLSRDVSAHWRASKLTFALR